MKTLVEIIVGIIVGILGCLGLVALVIGLSALGAAIISYLYNNVVAPEFGWRTISFYAIWVITWIIGMLFGSTSASKSK